MGPRFVRLDFRARLVIEAADEADLCEEWFRRIGGEIKGGVFLTDLRGNHKQYLVDQPKVLNRVHC